MEQLVVNHLESLLLFFRERYLLSTDISAQARGKVSEDLQKRSKSCYCSFCTNARVVAFMRLFLDYPQIKGTCNSPMSWNCWLCTKARCRRRCQTPARSQAASQRRLAAASRARTRCASPASLACAATCDPTTLSDTTMDLCESRSSRNSRWSWNLRLMIRDWRLYLKERLEEA